MPRPLRIEFEGAYYHVMNRGRGRQRVFHGQAYYQAFLQGLKETQQRFGLEIHAYCLMSNHYHLLISTPRGNLSRSMRHINGIYTQRYNRLKKTDGPLFRGRFKAILVDVDSYFLQLTRYIHRNPLEAKPPMVKSLDQYEWSSYPAYINQAGSPEWLSREFTYQLLGEKQAYRGYRRYVDGDVEDEKMRIFYSGKSHKPILGSDAFIERVIAEHVAPGRKTPVRKAQNKLPNSQEIVSKVADEFHISVDSILRSQRGPGSKNIARWTAISLCRELSGETSNKIVSYFNISHISGVSQAVKKLKQIASGDKKLENKLNIIYQQLTPTPPD